MSWVLGMVIHVAVILLHIETKIQKQFIMAGIADYIAWIIKECTILCEELFLTSTCSSHAYILILTYIIHVYGIMQNCYS